jgi:dTDP-4-amino-4,6-dideoxygalactose transaminase
VGVLSFGGSKLTAAGRGGAILTNSLPIIERIKRHTQRGNELSPLSELQAAALVPQWRALDERNELRALNARLLHERLGDDSGLRTVNPPPTTAGHYKIALEYDPSKFQNLPREQFCQAMRAEGIALSPGFRGLHRIHASRRFRAAGPLPVADRVDESVVVLHHPVLLGTSQEMEEILQAVSRVRRAAAEIFACFPDPPPPMEPDDE